MKVVSIVGARPQFIKAAVLSEKLRQQGQEILVHTGQHYDDNMSDVFFDELKIPQPDIHLGIGSGSHAEQTGRMLIEIESVLEREKPDWCVVFGDTNSTLAGALAAAKLHIRVAHVEAGLRSFNKAMPEEVNRVLCDHVSDALFCPTSNAAENLRNEGITQGIHVAGDIMGDMLKRSLERARKKSKILEQLDVQPKNYALATVHRAANTDNLDNLKTLLETFGKINRIVILPLHPRTRGMIQRNGLTLPESVRAIDPVGYFDMLQLEANADCILTDSGGMQKEAYWVGVRCITLREETEWVETVQAGWNRVVGTNPGLILDTVLNWLPQGERKDIYGDGETAGRIAGILEGMRKMDMP
ncbi:MAG: UDP-N-acetylglucosamine 2-epimerase (non-hydrolyzing) [Chloroflexi bacterium]|nr:UDP-N-acetylglucosamine 2-epimerase (non-hydrolyzing) [Chloroflexota bacterium]